MHSFRDFHRSLWNNNPHANFTAMNTSIARINAKRRHLPRQQVYCPFTYFNQTYLNTPRSMRTFCANSDA